MEWFSSFILLSYFSNSFWILLPLSAVVTHALNLLGSFAGAAGSAGAIALEGSGESEGVESESKMPLRMAVPKSPTSVSTVCVDFAVVVLAHTTAQDRQGEGFLAGVLGLLVLEPLRCLRLDGEGFLQDPVGGEVACHFVWEVCCGGFWFAWKWFWAQPLNV